ncbi:MAG TPA: hypothetical protein VM940_09515 [Chthoniobacterales bacterium]|nr:hypothetical protein [Chthoniobacterales bacterium]
MQLPPRSSFELKGTKANIAYRLTLVLTALLTVSPLALAQPPDRPDRPFRNERRARWANLSEDERSRLRAAHHKAMEDPAVQAARERLRQARREFREIMRPALLRADPSIQPILDKLRAERGDHR